jgi:Flp pilus assembly protein TadB
MSREYVDLICLLMFVFGIILIIYEDIKIMADKIQLRHSLKERSMNMRKSGKLKHHITMLLDMLPGKKMKASAFFTISAICFFTVFIVTANVMGAAVCIFASVFVGLLPYIVLRMKCIKLRTAIGQEREKLVSIMLSAYRMSNYNIEEAIEYTSSRKEDLPETSSLLSSLLLRLRECSNAEEIRKVTENFAEAAGGGWARILAVNIRMACTNGTDIHVTLEELLKQIREGKVLMEERMRSNSESLRMTTVMIPVTMAVTIVISLKQLDMSLKELITSQFSDNISCMLFLAIIILFMFNLAAAQLMKKRTIDLQ